jgi:hypothetical protein
LYLQPLIPRFLSGQQKGVNWTGNIYTHNNRGNICGGGGILHLPEVHIGSMCPLPYTILTCIKARGGCILLLQGCCQHKSLGKIGAWVLVLSACGGGIWVTQHTTVHYCWHPYLRMLKKLLQAVITMHSYYCMAHFIF